MALSNEEVSENLQVTVVHKNLQDAELRRHLLRSAATPDSFSSIKDDVINYSLAEAAARGTAPMDVNLVNLVQGKGNGKKEKGKVQGDERRCFCCDGKGQIKSNRPQKAIDDNKKSDSKRSPSTDNVVLVTLVATARENESSYELWIFAIAVGGKLGSGNGAPGEIAELMVDSGAALTTCALCFGTDALLGNWSQRTYTSRQVRVMFVATDIMNPVLSVAKLTEQGFKGMTSRDDGVSVELRRGYGTYWMVECAAKSSTVSPVTLSETIESPQNLPAIADVTKPATDIEISEEVKKAPAEPSELESELLSETHIPLGA